MHIQVFNQPAKVDLFLWVDHVRRGKKIGDVAYDLSDALAVRVLKFGFHKNVTVPSTAKKYACSYCIFSGVVL